PCFWEMADVFMFGVARPCRILLVRADGSSNRMQSLYKISVGVEGFENFRSDAGHDVHIGHDVGGIADLNAYLGDAGTKRAHAVGDDIHRPASHGTCEKLC